MLTRRSRKMSLQGQGAGQPGRAGDTQGQVADADGVVADGVLHRRQAPARRLLPLIRAALPAFGGVVEQRCGPGGAGARSRRRGAGRSAARRSGRSCRSGSASWRSDRAIARRLGQAQEDRAAGEGAPGPAVARHGRAARRGIRASAGATTSSRSRSWLAVPRIPRLSQVSTTRTPGVSIRSRKLARRGSWPSSIAAARRWA